MVRVNCFRFNSAKIVSTRYNIPGLKAISISSEEWNSAYRGHETSLGVTVYDEISEDTYIIFNRDLTDGKIPKYLESHETAHAIERIVSGRECESSPDDEVVADTFALLDCFGEVHVDLDNHLMHFLKECTITNKEIVSRVYDIFRNLGVKYATLDYVRDAYTNTIAPIRRKMRLDGMKRG